MRAQACVMQPSPPRPHDAFTERFLARVPAAVAASFSPAQLHAIRHAFGLRHEPAHDVDLRRRWGGFYVVLLAGRDGR
jgi:hypothetical protein